MPLEGKGFFIWKIHRCEKGDPGAIASRAREAGLSHVLIKMADGPRAYNVDLAAPLVEALKGAGIQVWGWQFVYGNEPFGEADIAVHRIRTLRLDGFVVNAEVDYKGKHAAASAYIDSLKVRVTGIPIALSSFRYPSYHPELPWTEFLSGCEYNMPQVYWVQADNPAQQLDRCIQQFRDIYPVLPIIPTGAAYEEYGWRPKPSELQQFLRHVRERGLPAVNFWSWDYAGSTEGRDLWNVIAEYDWPVERSQPDVVDILADALNRKDIETILALYQPNAVLVTPHHTLQGHKALRTYYTDLLTKELSGAAFMVETRINEGHIRHIRWDALSASNGMSVRDGQDTIALRQGLIQYHSSIYQIV
jgi:hypothetical protein